MTRKIDFSKGGYQGDLVEETYKGFTACNMPYWWHFREVLRVNHEASDVWTKANGSPLSDDEQRELIAVCMLNSTVYTVMAEAIAFFEQMNSALMQMLPQGWRVFEVRRPWTAMYASLRMALNALSSTVCVTVGGKSPFGERPGILMNFAPEDALELVRGKGLSAIAEPIKRCQKRLEILHHLDHYWLMWVSIKSGKFMVDANFDKQRVPLHPPPDMKLLDAQQLGMEHITDSAKDFNLVYEELSTSGGYLDKYLQSKGWKVDYSGYGPPHNGRRPKP